jgi:16S rRNA G966 N2-methylase RsmD
MHISAGDFEGIELYDNPDKGELTTRELTVKEEIFTIIGSRIVDSEVLDVNDMNGIYGVESISRGAKNCIFVNNNRKSNDVISKNLVKVGFNPEIHIQEKSAKDFVYELGDREVFRVIFFEVVRPEEIGLLSKLVTHLEEQGLIIAIIPVISGFNVPKEIPEACIQEARDCEQKTVLVINKVCEV